MSEQADGEGGCCVLLVFNFSKHGYGVGFNQSISKKETFASLSTCFIWREITEKVVVLSKFCYRLFTNSPELLVLLSTQCPPRTTRCVIQGPSGFDRKDPSDSRTFTVLRM